VGQERGLAAAVQGALANATANVAPRLRLVRGSTAPAGERGAAPIGLAGGPVHTLAPVHTSDAARSARAAALSGRRAAALSGPLAQGLEKTRYSTVESPGTLAAILEPVLLMAPVQTLRIV
jgi:hypothetical protein